MTLSAAFVDEHVKEWEAKLTGFAYPFRSTWPSRLFHHSALENAVKILDSNRLLSRNDAQREIVRDVAAVDVVGARDRAHDFARLYFRPRTPTQWHIEGVRKPGECRLGENTHAPILVMFVFDARQILTMHGVRFSDMNMQSNQALDSDTPAFFKTIPFDKVYHEGPNGGDQSITKHRCAEVLAPSPMIVGGKLQWIYCRSEAERDTLIYQMEYPERWRGRFKVSDDLRVFMKDYAFIEEVKVDKAGVQWRCNPRRDGKGLDMEVAIRLPDGKRLKRDRYEGLEANPPKARFWWMKTDLVDGFYEVELKIDGQLAYQNVHAVGNALF